MLQDMCKIYRQSINRHSHHLDYNIFGSYEYVVYLNKLYDCLRVEYDAHIYIVYLQIIGDMV